MNNTAQNIERLLQFGVQHKLIATLDVFVARNTLLDLFGLAEPYRVPCPKNISTRHRAFGAFAGRSREKELFDNEVPALRVNFEARIMGALMPRESEVATRFHQLWKTDGIQAATDYFYDLCITSNYIRTAQIAKNIKWDYPCKYGNLEITINLTKPEKDPRPSHWRSSSPPPATRNVCLALKISAMRAA